MTLEVIATKGGDSTLTMAPELGFDTLMQLSVIPRTPFFRNFNSLCSECIRDDYIYNLDKNLTLKAFLISKICLTNKIE